MLISAAIQVVEGDHDKLKTGIKSPGSSSETQLGHSSGSEILLLLRAFVQPGAIEGFAGYFLHGTCVLEQDTLAIRRSNPARCMRGHRRWKVGSGH